MKEHHHYVITWDSEEGWFLNEPLAKEMFQGVAVDVFGGSVETEEEALALLDLYKQARLSESLLETGARLEVQLNKFINAMNTDPLYLELE